MPGVNIKRTTLDDFCRKLRAELFDYTESPAENAAKPGDDSLLTPYVDKIADMLAANKPITVILTVIKAEGYSGSYSLLQQYCLMIRPTTQRTKKTSRKVKRRDLTSAVWSEKHDISDKDMSYIETNYPVLSEIKAIISEFRTAYSKKDIDVVKTWCEKYANCRFPGGCLSDCVFGNNLQ